jgi:hypothetical protein
MCVRTPLIARQEPVATISGLCVNRPDCRFMFWIRNIKKQDLTRIARIKGTDFRERGGAVRGTEPIVARIQGSDKAHD